MQEALVIGVELILRRLATLYKEGDKLVHTASPVVELRWLGRELQRLRKQARLTQQTVAKALGCSIGKVSYIENGERPALSVRELEEIVLPLYGVPEDRWPTYANACEASWEEGWWERYNDHVVPRWVRRYIGLEQGAQELRVFEPSIIHGLLQVSDYAAAIRSRWMLADSRERLARFVEFSTARQRVLTRSPDPLNLWVVLDEAALRRVVGSPAIMQAQLDHIADLVEQQSNVVVQILPFDIGAHGAVSGPFTLLGFPWPNDPGMLYVERRTGSSYIEDVWEIEEHSRLFDELCGLALSPPASIEILRAIAKEYAGG